VRILIVEDDPWQMDAIVASLAQSFPTAELLQLSTEREFCTAFDDLRLSPPDLVLMDVMLRWTKPSRHIAEPPEGVRSGGFRRAGFRCVARLQDAGETAHVPVVLYSVVDRADIQDDLRHTPSHVIYLHKDGDDKQLVRHLRSVLAGTGTVEGRRSSWAARVWDSIEAKPGWLGVTIDLKRLLKDRTEQ
jgi:DNA-binding NarL/FixJ family response regulator